MSNYQGLKFPAGHAAKEDMAHNTAKQKAATLLVACGPLGSRTREGNARHLARSLANTIEWLNTARNELTEWGVNDACADERTQIATVMDALENLGDEITSKAGLTPFGEWIDGR